MSFFWSKKYTFLLTILTIKSFLTLSFNWFFVKAPWWAASLKWPFANWTWLGKCFLSKSIDHGWKDGQRENLKMFFITICQKLIWPFYTGKLWRAIMNPMQSGRQGQTGKGVFRFWTAYPSTVIHQHICLHSCQTATSPMAGQLNRCKPIPWDARLLLHYESLFGKCLREVILESSSKLMKGRQLLYALSKDSVSHE